MPALAATCRRLPPSAAAQDIRNAAGDALSANNQSAVLVGDFGNMSEPSIDRFTVVVAANATNYTDGDSIVLHFDMRTNQGGGSQTGGGDRC